MIHWSWSCQSCSTGILARPFCSPCGGFRLVMGVSTINHHFRGTHMMSWKPPKFPTPKKHGKRKWWSPQKGRFPPPKKKKPTKFRIPAACPRASADLPALNGVFCSRFDGISTKNDGISMGFSWFSLLQYTINEILMIFQWDFNAVRLRVHGMFNGISKMPTAHLLSRWYLWDSHECRRDFEGISITGIWTEFQWDFYGFLEMAEMATEMDMDMIMRHHGQGLWGYEWYGCVYIYIYTPIDGW